MIAYKEFGSELIDQVMAIYRAEGWNLYTEAEKVMRAFDKSLFVLGAFEQDKLAGFIRCLGDGEYDVYVSDLIVDKPHRRRGIGTTLFQMVLKKYQDIENFTLITGLEETENNFFYRSAGMKELRENRLIGYIR